MQCLHFFSSNHHYLYSGIIVNHIVGTTLRRHLCYFFWAGCANFLPVKAKTLLFCILLCKLAYFMSEYVSLKGGIAHLYWCFMLCCRKFWNIAFVQFFVCTFCISYFLRLFRTLVHQAKERNIAKGKAARELSSA